MNLDRNIAVYAGTFDPVTNGHMDILQRALGVFSKVNIAIASGGPRSANKNTFFSSEQRLEMVEKSIKELLNEEDCNRACVDCFDGMLVDFVKKTGAKVIIRGLRAVSDYEYESQLAHTNRLLSPEIETVFFVTSGANSFISSSIVRNIALNGGDVSSIVPQAVVEAFLKNVRN